MWRNLFLTAPEKRSGRGQRFLSAISLMIVLPMAVSAYTLVLRNGQQIDISANFTVTERTMTYQVAPGISKTLVLNLIDIPATEKANNESPGSFYKHSVGVGVTTPVSQLRATRRITNRDLESTRRTRLESEKSYEKRRIELGLPSVEETRKEQARAEDDTLAWIREREAAKRADEAVWRGRAEELRNQIIAVDSQINYLQSRLDTYRQFPLATHSLATGVPGLAPLANRSAVLPRRIPRPGIVVSPRGRVNSFDRGRVLLNSERRDGFRTARTFNNGVGFGGSFGFPIGSTFPFGPSASPFDYVEDSYSRANVSDRLEDLLQQRAALSALWKRLEDEARDARIPQVWLEP